MLKFQDLLKGADTIHPDITSIQKTSKIVGRDAALAMLVVLLQNSCSEETIETVCGECGYLNMAVYLPSFGRGYVLDESGEYLNVIDVETMYEPESAEKAEEFALMMSMCGPNDVIAIPAGVYPYREAYDMMLRDHHEVLKSLGITPIQDEDIEEEDPPLGIGS